MGEKEWYFFNLRDRKYPTSLRTNRATEAGYWKTTGRDKEIFRGNTFVGMKKTLVFYKGRAPKGERTNWVMHEYRLENKFSFETTIKEEWVVCRVFKKTSCVKKLEDRSPPIYSHLSLNSPCEANPNITNGDTELVLNLNSPKSITRSCTVPKFTNGFGVIEVTPNLNSPSSICLNSLYNRNLKNGASMNMNWPAPNNALTSLLFGSNSSMNDLLLKALQLKNSAYQPIDIFQFNSDYCNFMSQGISQFRSDFSSNLSASSSTKGLNLLPFQQPQEQPFSLDSANW